jgi:hypothetical protein
MITIYSKNDCVQCKMTKKFLDQHKVEYNEINLDEQPEFIDHQARLPARGLAFLVPFSVSLLSLLPLLRREGSCCLPMSCTRTSCLLR